MAYQLIWAPSARLDLKELALYIAESRPIVAARFVKQVFRIVEHLADFPESGRVVPEFDDPNIREVIRRPCRIVYRIKSQERTVEIARVWHAARGTPQL
jgi:plasmid stabilization system protein ParE